MTVRRTDGFGSAAPHVLQKDAPMARYNLNPRSPQEELNSPGTIRQLRTLTWMTQEYMAGFLKIPYKKGTDSPLLKTRELQRVCTCQAKAASTTHIHSILPRVQAISTESSTLHSIPNSFPRGVTGNVFLNPCSPSSFTSCI